MSGEVNIFLSSAMTGELEAERECIKSSFATVAELKHYFHLIYIEQSAKSKKVQTACRDEVKNSKIMLLILNKDLRPAVVDEFQTALENKVKILCYVKTTARRNAKMKEFIDKLPVTYCPFSSTSDLVQKIISDIKQEVISVYLATNSGLPELVSFPNVQTTYRYFTVSEIIKSANDPTLSKYSVEELIGYALSMIFEQGRYKDALMLLEIAIFKDPDNWMAYNNIGYVLDEMGKTDAALFNYKKSLSLKPTETAYYNIAIILMHKGKLKEAIEYYLKALELQPKKVIALNNMVNCYIKLMNYPEALKYSEISFKLEEDDFSIANYAITLGYNNDFENACKIAEKLKGKEMYHRVNSILLYQQKNYLDVIPEIDKIQEIDYEMTKLKFTCLVLAGKKEAAMKWLEHIENNFPIDSEEYNNMGWILLSEMKDYETAVSLFKKAVEIDKYNINAWVNWQFACLSLELYEEALDVCDKTAEVYSFDAKTINNKNVALIALGRFDEAIKTQFKKGQQISNSNITDEQVQEQFKNILGFIGTDVETYDRLMSFLETLYELRKN